MKNQVQAGDALNVVAPAGGFVSGYGYQIGSMFGIAGFTCPAGAVGVLWLVGVFQLPKAVGETWAAGDPIYWSPSFLRASKTNSSSDIKIGVASDPVVGTLVGNVRLNGAF